MVWVKFIFIIIHRKNRMVINARVIVKMLVQYLSELYQFPFIDLLDPTMGYNE